MSNQEHTVPMNAINHGSLSVLIQSVTYDFCHQNNFNIFEKNRGTEKKKGQRITCIYLILALLHVMARNYEPDLPGVYGC